MFRRLLKVLYILYAIIFIIGIIGSIKHLLTNSEEYLSVITLALILFILTWIIQYIILGILSPYSLFKRRQILENCNIDKKENNINYIKNPTKTSLKINKILFWKIYFYMIILGTIISFLPGLGSAYDKFYSMLVLFIVYSFIEMKTKNKADNLTLWKSLFIIQIIASIYPVWKLGEMFKTANLIQLNFAFSGHGLIFAIAVSALSIIFMYPSLYANYILAFKQNKLLMKE